MQKSPSQATKTSFCLHWAYCLGSGSNRAPVRRKHAQIHNLQNRIAPSDHIQDHSFRLSKSSAPLMLKVEARKELLHCDESIEAGLSAP